MCFIDHIGPRIGLRTSTVEGKKAYSQHMWLLRFHSSLFFSRCEVSMFTKSDPIPCDASICLAEIASVVGISLHNGIEDLG